MEQIKAVILDPFGSLAEFPPYVFDDKDSQLQSMDEAEIYEDVVPALTELRSMGISLVVVSSLSTDALNRLLDRLSLRPYFSAVWSTDGDEERRGEILAKAMTALGSTPDQVMVLVDTAEGVAVAKEVGANSILMINDYDEGRRLAMHDPAGAVVSLHELPDAIRLIAESQKTPTSSR
jgi:beta-phosphoglucomutase-like phosphatase (HAD superfamily)